MSGVGAGAAIAFFLGTGACLGGTVLAAVSKGVLKGGQSLQKYENNPQNAPWKRCAAKIGKIAALTLAGIGSVIAIGAITLGSLLTLKFMFFGPFITLCDSLAFGLPSVGIGAGGITLAILVIKDVSKMIFKKAVV